MEATLQHGSRVLRAWSLIGSRCWRLGLCAEIGLLVCVLSGVLGVDDRGGEPLEERRVGAARQAQGLVQVPAAAGLSGCEEDGDGCAEQCS